MAKKARGKTREGAASSFDYLTLLGVTMAVGAIVGGNQLEGGDFGALMQLTAFIIVMGGTLGAVLIQTPLRDFIIAVRRLSRVFVTPSFQRRALIESVLAWSRVSRSDGLLALEKIMEKEKDPFVRKGLTLLIDGSEPDEIRSVMDVEIDNTVSTESNAARVYEAMGGYSPTIGIIGAVLGLIDVMNNLSDPSELGSGIAVAFVATIYGVGFANLFFLPISNKLKAIYGDQMQFQEMVVDGIALIADGESPGAIQSKLEGYLD